MIDAKSILMDIVDVLNKYNIKDGYELVFFEHTYFVGFPTDKNHFVVGIKIEGEGDVLRIETVIEDDSFLEKIKQESYCRILCDLSVVGINDLLKRYASEFLKYG